MSQPNVTWDVDCGAITVPADAPRALRLFLDDIPCSDIDDCRDVLEGLRAVQAGEAEEWLCGWNASWLRITPEAAHLRYAFNISPNEWEPISLPDLFAVLSQVIVLLERSDPT